MQILQICQSTFCNYHWVLPKVFFNPYETALCPLNINWRFLTERLEGVRENIALGQTTGFDCAFGLHSKYCGPIRRCHPRQLAAVCRVPQQLMASGHECPRNILECFPVNLTISHFTKFTFPSLISGYLVISKGSPRRSVGFWIESSPVRCASSCWPPRTGRTPCVQIDFFINLNGSAFDVPPVSSRKQPSWPPREPASCLFFGGRYGVRCNLRCSEKPHRSRRWQLFRLAEKVRV